MTASPSSSRRRWRASKRRPRTSNGSSSGSRSTTGAVQSSSRRRAGSSRRRVEPRDVSEDGHRRPAVCARAPRSRSRDPHLRGAAHLELPAVAVGLRGARLRRDALARLRRGAAPRQRWRSMRSAAGGSAPDEPARSRDSSSSSFCCPLVIGLVYLGGWWLFGLALVGGLLALHELYVMARDAPPARPGRLPRVRRHAARPAARRARAGCSAGCSSTFVFAFVVYGLGGVRQSATTSFGVTLLGVAWVGAGLGCLLLVRDIPDFGFWAVMAVLFTVFARIRERSSSGAPSDVTAWRPRSPRRSRGRASSAAWSRRSGWPS